MGSQVKEATFLEIRNLNLPQSYPKTLKRMVGMSESGEESARMRKEGSARDVLTRTICDSETGQVREGLDRKSTRLNSSHI